MRLRVTAWVAAPAIAFAWQASALTTPSSVVPQAERNDVATLKPMEPHWVITSGQNGGMYIFNTDDGKMQGEIANYGGNFAIDPAGRFFYTSETFYAHRNRGVRDDVVTVWDSKTLQLIKEIRISGRMLVGSHIQNFQLSSDGTHAFIYNMMPSSSVIVVDLSKQKMEQTIELPGCAGVYPNSSGGFSALCSDGSLATVSVGSTEAHIARGAPFFDALMDPLYDNSIADPKTGKAIFLSYSGLIYQATLGSDATTVSAPWSIQEAANMKKAEAAPLAVAWYPGGSQPFAVHHADGHIYVLMHLGEYWSHGSSATEIWILDGTTRKLIRRAELPDKISGANIAVSQDAVPKVFVTEGRRPSSGKLVVLDGVTLKKDRVIDESGGGTLFVKS